MAAIKIDRNVKEAVLKKVVTQGVLSLGGLLSQIIERFL